MGSINRYIVGTTFGAFALIVISLTSVVWITHALRDIDIVTNQGQSVLAFVGITALIIPLLLLVVAPLALILAVGHTLNRLNTDSEIVVMNAAGMSPWRVFSPFLIVALITAAGVFVVSAYVTPKALREMRIQLTKVRADLIANLMQPGRFTSLDGNRLTVHVRERRSNGELGGIFIDDRRDANERGTYIAEHGQVIESAGGTLLVLAHGSAQRSSVKQPDPAIVFFDRYAFDLTPFTRTTDITTFGVPERFIWELIWPDPKDPLIKSGALTRELHERLAAPLYPIVFVIIGFAVLGAPRTSRQSRSVSVVLTIVLVATVRLLGFAISVLAARFPSAVFGLYAMFAAITVGGLWLISRGAIIEPPATALAMANSFLARINGEAVPATRGAPA